MNHPIENHQDLEAGEAQPQGIPEATAPFRRVLSCLLRSASAQVAFWSLVLGGAGLAAVWAGHEPESIVIDYPQSGSLFPVDMAAPTFLWRDPSPDAALWQIEVKFASGAAAMHLVSKGERMQVGEIDPRCIANTNKLPELTPEQAAAHTWKPDVETWKTIKQRAGSGAVTIAIAGRPDADAALEVSRGAMEMRVSSDPVGAPIFFRDVPLMPSETEKGFIKPLAQNAIPLINWSMRYVGDDRSHVVMHDLHTCANCHSFAANGKTLGLDLDGPQNDK